MERKRAHPQEFAETRKRLKFGPGPHDGLWEGGTVGRSNRLPLLCSLWQSAQFLDGRSKHVRNVSILRVLAHRLPVEEVARGQCPAPVEEFLRNDLFDRFERKRQCGVPLRFPVQQRTTHDEVDFPVPVFEFHPRGVFLVAAQTTLERSIAAWRQESDPLSVMDE